MRPLFPAFRALFRLIFVVFSFLPVGRGLSRALPPVCPCAGSHRRCRENTHPRKGRAIWAVCERYYFGLKNAGERSGVVRGSAPLTSARSAGSSGLFRRQSLSAFFRPEEVQKRPKSRLPLELRDFWPTLFLFRNFPFVRLFPLRFSALSGAGFARFLGSEFTPP